MPPTSTRTTAPAGARRLAALLTLAAAGCAGAPAPHPGLDAPPPAPVRRSLPAGSVVQLAPTTAGPATADGAAEVPVLLDPLWREAMRLSPYLDVAAGVESTDTELVIVVHLDGGSGRLTSALRAGTEAPLPLASATGTLPGAIDALALATRQALGETVVALPPSCKDIYSDRPECVRLTEAALVASSRGDPARAESELRRARRADPGCTITEATLAKTLLTLGTRRADPRLIEEAERVALETLRLDQRLAPTTQHRLAHALLAARSMRTGYTERADHELLQLADATLRERPYDPHALFSKAVALNFLRRYRESAPLLRRLAARWPQSADVGYHATFAELAVGHPEAARAQIERVMERLPRHTVVVPRALALYFCDRHAELASYLEQLATDPVYSKSAGLHELRRMQAALAVLTDRADDAARFLLSDLEWIRQRPTQLERLALDVAESCEVLVRMGRTRDLAVRLQAFEQIGDLPPTFRQVLVFGGGLVAVSESGKRAEAAEAELRKDGWDVWASVLEAWGHQRRGELMDEMRERLFEVQRSQAPLAQAGLARVLEAAGKPARARETLGLLRSSLLEIDLRHPGHHPLMSPAAALAFLATSP